MHKKSKEESKTRQDGITNLERYDSFEDFFNDEQIRRTAYHAARNFRRCLDRDDIESEINFTLFNVWKLYDGERAKLNTYIHQSVYNNVRHLANIKERNIPLDRIDPMLFHKKIKGAFVTNNDVSFGISAKDKFFIEEKIRKNKTFKEISHCTGLSEFLVKKHYNDAINGLKNVSFA